MLLKKFLVEFRHRGSFRRGKYSAIPLWGGIDVARASPHFASVTAFHTRNRLISMNIFICFIRLLKGQVLHSRCRINRECGYEGPADPFILHEEASQGMCSDDSTYCWTRGREAFWPKVWFICHTLSWFLAPRITKAFYLSVNLRPSFGDRNYSEMSLGTSSACRNFTLCNL